MRRNGVCNESRVDARPGSEKANPLIQRGLASLPEHGIEVTVHTDHYVPVPDEREGRDYIARYKRLKRGRAEVTDPDERDISIVAEVCRVEWEAVDQRGELGNTVVVRRTILLTNLGHASTSASIARSWSMTASRSRSISSSGRGGMYW